MLVLFGKAFAISLFALLISFLGLAGIESYGLISIFIVAFFVHRNLVEFFLENKTNIIDKKADSKKENIRTYTKIGVLFLGIALGYGLYMGIFSSNYLMETFRDLLIKTSYVTGINVSYPSFGGVFATNIAALAIAGIFTVIFEEYAVALLVSLGAVVLGISSGFLFSLGNMDVGQKIFSFFFVVLPNSFTVFSLICLSVGTYYLVKGRRNYAKREDNESIVLLRNIRATFFIILASSLVINLLATVWESVLLPILR